MELTNYHTHTWRCKHAEGTEESYILAAIESGFKVLGFSDHTPWPYRSNFIATMRMPIGQLEGYIQTVRALGEKYADRIEIPLGLECEAFPEFFGWLSDLKAEKLDYLILGNHFAPTDERGGFYFGACRQPEQMRQYLNYTVEAMRTGLFNYVAHADLFMRMASQYDAECAAMARELCEASKALNVPLEYNLLGLRYKSTDTARDGAGYPCEGFWETAAAVGCPAIIGMDAHRTEHMRDVKMFESARAHLETLGLQVVERIL